MKNLYNKEVKTAMMRITGIKPDIINKTDLEHLPKIVKKYLNYIGVVGKEKVLNFKVKFDGKIRSKPKDKWMLFASEQYNFFNNPTRIFYIKAWKMGIPATGIHLYKNEKAIMIIKLAGIFKVVDAKGPEMDQGETVTLFNDMCFFAPATLIDKNIKWEIIDNLSVNAKFTNGNITIGATLIFNEIGELINFISNDRFETTDGKTYKNYPWSTPVKEYKNYNGIKAASLASTIYHKPDSDFCYGEFRLINIKHNCHE